MVNMFNNNPNNNNSSSSDYILKQKKQVILVDNNDNKNIGKITNSEDPSCCKVVSTKSSGSLLDLKSSIKRFVLDDASKNTFISYPQVSHIDNTSDNINDCTYNINSIGAQSKKYTTASFTETNADFTNLTLSTLTQCETAYIQNLHITGQIHYPVHHKKITSTSLSVDNRIIEINKKPDITFNSSDAGIFMNSIFGGTKKHAFMGIVAGNNHFSLFKTDASFIDTQSYSIGPSAEIITLEADISGSLTGKTATVDKTTSGTIEVPNNGTIRVNSVGSTYNELDTLIGSRNINTNKINITGTNLDSYILLNDNCRLNFGGTPPAPHSYITGGRKSTVDQKPYMSFVTVDQDGTTASDQIYFDSTGVGIRNTDPKVELDISGSANITKTVTAKTFIGDLSGTLFGNATSATTATSAGSATTADTASALTPITTAYNSGSFSGTFLKINSSTGKLELGGILATETPEVPKSTKASGLDHEQVTTDNTGGSQTKVIYGADENGKTLKTTLIHNSMISNDLGAKSIDTAKKAAQLDDTKIPTVTPEKTSLLGQKEGSTVKVSQVDASHIPSALPHVNAGSSDTAKGLSNPNKIDQGVPIVAHDGTLTVKKTLDGDNISPTYKPSNSARADSADSCTGHSVSAGQASHATLADTASKINVSGQQTKAGIVKTIGTDGTIQIGKLEPSDIPDHASNTSGNAASSSYSLNAATANISMKTKSLDTSNNGFVKTINSNGTIDITTIQSSDLPSIINSNTSGNAATASSCTGNASTATTAVGMLNNSSKKGVVYVDGDNKFIIDENFKPASAGKADSASFAEGFVVPNPIPIGTNNQGYLKTTNSQGSSYEFYKTIPNKDLPDDISHNSLEANNIVCHDTITSSKIIGDLSGTAQIANQLNVSGSGYIQMDEQGNLSAKTIATYHLPTEISCTKLTSTDISGTTATIGSVSMTNNTVTANTFIGNLSGNATTATTATTATMADKINPTKITNLNTSTASSFLQSDRNGNFSTRTLISSDLPSQITADTTGKANSATSAEQLQITGSGIITAVSGSGKYSNIKLENQITSEQLPTSIDASKISGTVSNATNATNATYAKKVYNNSNSGIVTVDENGNLSVRSLTGDDIPNHNSDTTGKAGSASSSDKAKALDVSQAGFVKVDASGNITPGEIQASDISNAVASANVSSASTAKIADNLKGKIYYNSNLSGQADFQSKQGIVSTDSAGNVKILQPQDISANTAVRLTQVDAAIAAGEKGTFVKIDNCGNILIGSLLATDMPIVPKADAVNHLKTGVGILSTDETGATTARQVGTADMAKDTKTPLAGGADTASNLDNKVGTGIVTHDATTGTTSTRKLLSNDADTTFKAPKAGGADTASNLDNKVGTGVVAHDATTGTTSTRKLLSGDADTTFKAPKAGGADTASNLDNKIGSGIVAHDATTGTTSTRKLLSGDADTTFKAPKAGGADTASNLDNKVGSGIIAHDATAGQTGARKLLSGDADTTFKAPKAGGADTASNLDNKVGSGIIAHDATTGTTSARKLLSDDADTTFKAPKAGGADTASNLDNKVGSGIIAHDSTTGITSARKLLSDDADTTFKAPKAGGADTASNLDNKVGSGIIAHDATTGTTSARKLLSSDADTTFKAPKAVGADTASNLDNKVGSGIIAHNSVTGITSARKLLSSDADTTFKAPKAVGADTASNLDNKVGSGIIAHDATTGTTSARKLLSSDADTTFKAPKAGGADTATAASNIHVQQNVDSTLKYITFTTTDGSTNLYVNSTSNTGLTYNPNLGELFTKTFKGDIKSDTANITTLTASKIIANQISYTKNEHFTVSKKILGLNDTSGNTISTADTGIFIKNTFSGSLKNAFFGIKQGEDKFSLYKTANEFTEEEPFTLAATDPIATLQANLEGNATTATTAIKANNLNLSSNGFVYYDTTGGITSSDTISSDKITFPTGSNSIATNISGFAAKANNLNLSSNGFVYYDTAGGISSSDTISSDKITFPTGNNTIETNISGYAQKAKQLDITTTGLVYNNSLNEIKSISSTGFVYIDEATNSVTTKPILSTTDIAFSTSEQEISTNISGYAQKAKQLFKSGSGLVHTDTNNDIQITSGTGFVYYDRLDTTNTVSMKSKLSSSDINFSLTDPAIPVNISGSATTADSATSATSATKIKVALNELSETKNYVTFVTQNSGDRSLYTNSISSTGLMYTPKTGTLETGALETATLKSNEANIGSIDISNNIFTANGNITSTNGIFSTHQGNIYSQSGNIYSQSGNIYTDNGRIGIGTTSPTEKLDISNGNIKVENGNIYTTNNGKIGIGITVPTESLDISGNAKMSGNIDISGISNLYGRVNISNDTHISGNIYANKIIGDISINELKIGKTDISGNNLTTDNIITNDLNVNNKIIELNKTSVEGFDTGLFINNVFSGENPHAFFGVRQNSPYFCLYNINTSNKPNINGFSVSNDAILGTLTANLNGTADKASALNVSTNGFVKTGGGNGTISVISAISNDDLPTILSADTTGTANKAKIVEVSNHASDDVTDDNLHHITYVNSSIPANNLSINSTTNTGLHYRPKSGTIITNKASIGSAKIGSVDISANEISEQDTVKIDLSATNKEINLSINDPIKLSKKYNKKSNESNHFSIMISAIKKNDVIGGLTYNDNFYIDIIPTALVGTEEMINGNISLKGFDSIFENIKFNNFKEPGTQNEVDVYPKTSEQNFKLWRQNITDNCGNEYTGSPPWLYFSTIGAHARYSSNATGGNEGEKQFYPNLRSPSFPNWPRNNSVSDNGQNSILSSVGSNSNVQKIINNPYFQVYQPPEDISINPTNLQGSGKSFSNQINSHIINDSASNIINYQIPGVGTNDGSGVVINITDNGNSLVSQSTSENLLIGTRKILKAYLSSVGTLKNLQSQPDPSLTLIQPGGSDFETAVWRLNFKNQNIRDQVWNLFSPGQEIKSGGLANNFQQWSFNESGWFFTNKISILKMSERSDNATIVDNPVIVQNYQPLYNFNKDRLNIFGNIIGTKATIPDISGNLNGNVTGTEANIGSVSIKNNTVTASSFSGTLNGNVNATKAKIGSVDISGDNVKATNLLGNLTGPEANIGSVSIKNNTVTAGSFSGTLNGNVNATEAKIGSVDISGDNVNATNLLGNLNGVEAKIGSVDISGNNVKATNLLGNVTGTEAKIGSVDISNNTVTAGSFSGTLNGNVNAAEAKIGSVDISGGNIKATNFLGDVSATVVNVGTTKITNSDISVNTVSATTLYGSLAGTGVSGEFIINAPNEKISVSEAIIDSVIIKNGAITGINTLTASTFRGDLVGDVSANKVSTRYLVIAGDITAPLFIGDLSGNRAKIGTTDISGGKIYTDDKIHTTGEIVGKTFNASGSNSGLSKMSLLGVGDVNSILSSDARLNNNKMLIVGNSNFDGSVNVTNNLKVDGSVNVQNNLKVEGNINCNSNLSTSKNIYSTNGNIYSQGGLIYTSGSGKIGVGTSNPSESLEIIGNAKVSNKIIGDLSSNTGVINTLTSTGSTIKNLTVNDSIIFGSSTTQFKINSNNIFSLSKADGLLINENQKLSFNNSTITSNISLHSNKLQLLTKLTNNPTKNATLTIEPNEQEILVGGKLNITQSLNVGSNIVLNNYSQENNVGQLQFADNSSYITGTGSTDSNTPSLQFYTKQKKRLTINHDGYIGIGKNPSLVDNLDISGSVKAAKFSGDFHGTLNTNSLTIGTNIINQTNLGIGTTSPSKKLHIYDNSLPTTFNDIVKLEQKVTSKQVTSGPGIKFSNKLNTTSYDLARICAINNSADNNGGTLQFQVNSGISNTLETYMTIDDDGTTTFKNNRVIDPSLPLPSTHTIVLNKNGLGNITTSGKIGIGITDPTVALDVSGEATISKTLTLNDNLYMGDNIIYTGILNAASIISVGTNAGLNKLGILGVGDVYSVTFSDSRLNSNKMLVIGNSYFDGIISTTDKIGIGVTSPSVALDVSGSGKISQDLTVSNNATIIKDLTVNASANIKGNLIVPSGKIGVGITDPTVALDISGDATISKTLRVQGSLEMSDNNIYCAELFVNTIYSIGKTAGLNKLGLLGVGDVGSVTFSDSRLNSNKMLVIGNSYFDGIISTTDKIGVGTSNPACPLTLNFIGASSGEISSPAASNLGSDLAQRVHWGMKIGTESINTPANIGGGAGIKFQPRSQLDDVRYAGICGISEHDYSNKVGLSFWTSHTNDAGTGTPKESMRIASNGYVGIGQTSPAYLLDVNGNCRISGDLKVSGSIVSSVSTSTFNDPVNANQGLTVDGGYLTVKYGLNHTGGPVIFKDIACGNINGSGNILASGSITSNDGMNVYGGKINAHDGLVVSGGRCGVGTSVPLSQLHIGDQYEIDHGNMNIYSLSIFDPQPVDSTNMKPIIDLFRKGNQGINYAARAQLSLGRYDDSTASAHTRLSFNLLDGDGDAATPNEILQLNANETFLINSGGGTSTINLGNQTLKLSGVSYPGLEIYSDSAGTPASQFEMYNGYSGGYFKIRSGFNRTEGGYGVKLYSNDDFLFNDSLYAPHYYHTSDDRLKHNEVLITNATKTLLKLRPQIYDKAYDISNPKKFRKEAGLIAQEIYYEIPELRYIVRVPHSAELTKDYTNVNFSDIKNDPNYGDWGENTAGVNYNSLFAYLIKGFQEQNEVINNLKTQNLELDSKQQEHNKEIETLNNKIDSQQSEIDLLKTQMAEILKKINK